MRHVLIFAGGELGNVKFDEVAKPDFVIAADSGLHFAQQLGVPVNLAVGDFDSADVSALERATAAGVTFERHPVAKNATDLEIALNHALELQAEAVTVVGGAGGRLDHLLAIPLLLARPSYGAMAITARTGEAIISVIRRRTALVGVVGDYVSLIPVHGEASGITTEGLRYPLSNGVLHAGTTRGVSNEFGQSKAWVQVDSGVLLAVQPGHR